jgi:catechol 2,3-dioxygenase-like lactoylglutathione lyase family enzyme
MGKESSMLNQSSVQPMLPVKDLEGAQKFYEQTLGLERVALLPKMAATYKSGDSTLVVYHSEYAGTNKGTAALWEVDDVEVTAKELKSKGVQFEKYDNMPGVTRTGDIHRAGDWKVAWFKDPAGNILSIQDKPKGDGRSH